MLPKDMLPEELRFDRGEMALGGFLLTCLAGFITHIVVCVAANTASGVALLLVGLTFFPIAVLHGWSIWLGVPWV